MKVLFRGGPLDGKTGDVNEGIDELNVPWWNLNDYWTDGHPIFPVQVPAFGAVVYHRTDEIVAGLVVFA